MRIKSSTILLIIIMFILVIRMRFFYLVFNVSSILMPLMIICALIFCLVFCKNKIIIICRNMKLMNYYVAFALCVYLAIFCYTDFVFTNQSFRDTFYISLPYFSLILVYPLICLQFYNNGSNILFKMFNIIALIWYVIVILQSIVYSLSGNVFLLNYFQSWTATRNGGLIRINLFEFGNLMIIYNFYKFYTERSKNKIIYLLLLIMGVYALIFIEQTRMFNIAVFLSLMFIVLNSGEKSYRLVKNSIIILIMLIVLPNGVFPKIIESFAINGKDAISTENRIYALKYYWNYFLGHPLFGMGYAHSLYYPTVVKGSSQIAATSDVGFVGQLAKIGISAIPLYIGMCIRFIYITKQIKKSCFLKQYPLYLAMLVFIICTSMTLIIFDMDRYLLYPVFVAVFEFKYYEIKKNQNAI